jgi:hypothetical protein
MELPSICVTVRQAVRRTTLDGTSKHLCNGETGSEKNYTGWSFEHCNTDLLHRRRERKKEKREEEEKKETTKQTNEEEN